MAEQQPVFDVYGFCAIHTAMHAYSAAFLEFLHILTDQMCLSGRLHFTKGSCFLVPHFEGPAMLALCMSCVNTHNIRHLDATAAV